MSSTFRPYSPERYWDERYRRNRTSGEGSEGQKAVAKAQRINDLIRVEDVESIIDWGVGDGTVLSMIDSSVPYLGVDIAPITIQRLQEHYRQTRYRKWPRMFKLADQAWLDADAADLAMSLDVIFHCVEHGEYQLHLLRVFTSAQRLVLIHSSDHDGGRTARHVRWRRWTSDVAALFPQWTLVERPSDPRAIGFYLYRRTE